ncbi:MAG: dockerin type I domain-containing protein [Acutalibacteraceae bacterium]
MKRLLGIALTMVMIFGVFAIESAAAVKIPSEKTFIQKMAELEKKYPTDSKWTGTYKENGYSYASQCRGYANQIAYEVFGSSEYTSGGGWSKSTSMGTLYAGDMVRISNSKGPDAHSIFITKVDGDDIYFTDCNWIGADTVRWGGHYTKSQLKEKFNYKFHLSGNNLTGTHICDKSKSLGAAKAHPHYTQYVCSICGKTWEDEGSKNYKETLLGPEKEHPHYNQYKCSVCDYVRIAENEPNSLIDSCYDCQPEPETPTLQYDVNKRSVTFSWNKCKNANYYDLYVKDFEGNDYSVFGIKDTAYTLTLEPGGYYAYCSAAYSDIKCSTSDEVFLYVSDESYLDYAYPDATVKYNGNTYELYWYSADWHTANEWCQSKNAHLATITSAEEKSVIDSLIRESGFEGKLWLGATVSSGKVSWIDGSSSSYTNWADEQPSNGKYVYVDTDLSNNWATGYSDSKSFILEREAGDLNPDDFEYEITDDNNVKISGYYGDEQTLKLPIKLDGKTVTAIGAYAFANADIKLITVPESVTEIDDCVFGYYPSEDLTIRCVEGSAAYDYAVKNDIKFELIDNTVTYGDANGDGSINMLDVLLIRKHIAKQPVELNLDASDVTCDGAVNMLDVLLIRKYIAKQPVTLGPKE